MAEEQGVVGTVLGAAWGKALIAFVFQQTESGSCAEREGGEGGGGWGSGGAWLS